MSCRFPQIIPSPLNPKEHIYVPCGKCAWCRNHRRDEWFVRFKEEAKNNLFVDFVTLTYDPQFLPLDGVEKSDVQKFLKRLRRNQNQHIKYFVASEYGPQTNRPHYHGLFFHDDKPITSDDYAAAWRSGFVDSEPAGEASYKYVTKYILKGSSVPDGQNDNFMLCSRRPAIGSDFLKGRYFENLRDTDVQLYTDNGGIKYSLPRYFRKKIKDSFGEWYEEIQHDKLAEMEMSQKFKYERERFKKTYPDKDEYSQDFENWLSDVYQKDFVKQIKINTNDTRKIK